MMIKLLLFMIWAEELLIFPFSKFKRAFSKSNQLMAILY